MTVTSLWNHKSSSQQSQPWFWWGVDIWTAAAKGNIEAVKQHLASGADVNPKTTNVYDFSYDGRTPLDVAIQYKQSETAALLRKHGGKTGAELKVKYK